MEIIIIIPILFIIIIIALFQRENHEGKIRTEIEGMGGEVIKIEHKVFSTGPFLLVGKGRTVYRIEYRINNQIREGWVKFGGLFGPDWRL